MDASSMAAEERRLWISGSGGGLASMVDPKWQLRRNREGKVAVLVCKDIKAKAAICKAKRGENVNRLPRFTRPLRHDKTPPSEDRAHVISGHALKRTRRITIRLINKLGTIVGKKDMEPKTLLQLI